MWGQPPSAVLVIVGGRDKDLGKNFCLLKNQFRIGIIGELARQDSRGRLSPRLFGLGSLRLSFIRTAAAYIVLANCTISE